MESQHSTTRLRSHALCTGREGILRLNPTNAMTPNAAPP